MSATHVSKHAVHATKMLAEGSFVLAVGLISVVSAATLFSTWLFG